MRPKSWPTARSLFGQPVAANGIALSKIHHAAFDNHLIGMDQIEFGEVEPACLCACRKTVRLVWSAV